MFGRYILESRGSRRTGARQWSSPPAFLARFCRLNQRLNLDDLFLEYLRAAAVNDKSLLKELKAILEWHGGRRL